MIRLILFFVSLSATLLIGAGCLPCCAQSVRLSVDSLFRLIDERSRTVRLQTLRVDDAGEGESVARSHRLPSLDASLSVGYLGNGHLSDRDFSGGMSVHNPHSANNFAVEAMQVVYSGGAVSGGIRLAELNTEVAKLDLEQGRQQVRFLMLGWLIDLQCLRNRRRVLDENIGLARRMLEDMRTRREEGVVLQSDITRYELQLEEVRLQREKTDESLRTINYRLANALGFPVPDTEFEPELPSVDLSAPVAAESHWQQVARGSNLSLKRAGFTVDIMETNSRIVAADKRPRLFLYAYGKFDSPIVTEVPVLNKNFMYWGFGVGMSFRISSLYTANRRIRQARIAEMESREAYELRLENVQNDVQAAYESYRTAATELRTREKSLELALRNYDIVSDRYANGMVLVTDMVDAANVRLASEIGLENAKTMLLFCYYRLKYITDTL